MKPSDNRVSKRIPSKRAARVKAIDGAMQEIDAQTRDISMRGVFIYMERHVMEGSILEIVLPLPEGITDAQELWVRCKCRIVRVEETGHGKEFGVDAIIEEYEPLTDSASGMAQA
ncbi:MAG: PilZ domain-containing protein [Terriglobales bacterium]